MPTHQTTLPADALRAIYKHMKNTPLAADGNPAELSRSEMVAMVRTHFPHCTLTPRNVDRLHEICKIIGKLYDPQAQMVIRPELGLGWSPHMLIIHNNQATVLRIEVMPYEVYQRPETWHDYDAYARLPPEQRTKIKIGLAAQKILENMPQIKRITATTLVCIIGHGPKGPIKEKFRELKVFQRA